MGFWNKLGKIALQAAPYVAAPFTGGTSLLATGATQKLGQKWAESDAKKNMAKGLAPSKFDRALGGISGVASLASGIGGVGGFGGKLAGMMGKAPAAGGWASKLGGLLGGGAGALGGGRNPYIMDESGAFGGMRSGGNNDWLRNDIGSVNKQVFGGGGSKIPWGQIAGIGAAGLGGYLAGRGTGGGGGGQGEGMWGPQTMGPNPGMYNPDLGPAIAAGRNQAMADQPWRTPLQNFDMNSPIQPWSGQAMPTRATDRNRMRQVGQ